MSRALIIPGSSFAQHSLCTAKRVLLINPHVIDYRLEWASWHHPLGLEMVGAMLMRAGSDVKLIDCLAMGQNRLAKHKVGVQKIDGYEYVRWRFGLPISSLKVQLRRLVDWNPEAVMVSTLNSLWWQGAVETIQAVREVLPMASVALGGMYPTIMRDHAVAHSGADFVVTGHVPEALATTSSFGLTANDRKSAGILFYYGEHSHSQSEPRIRPAADVVEEIIDGTRRGIREFVFFDERIRLEDGEAFHDLLAAIAAAKLGVSLVLQGNVPPRLIDSRIAGILRPAGVRQVYLRCELDHSGERIRYVDDVAEYDRCARVLADKGEFPPRSGAVAAMLVVGLPFEDLTEVSERLVRLAHVVGSVLLVPFQFVPALHTQAIFRRVRSLNGHLEFDDFNSKLFPLARLSGQPLEEYLELVRLAALVNSKYRSKTFDFLGDGMAARLLRESVRGQRWNPFSKGETALPEETPTIPLTPARKNEA